MTRPFFAARVFLAALLLVGFFSGILPLASLAGGPTCHLDCCAGRAPHAAGSCMNGTCHAVLSTRSQRHTHLQVITPPAEHLCGLPTTRSLINRLTVIAVKEGAQRTHDRARSETSLVATSLGKPCESDCGTCSVSSFSSRHRERTNAALAYANKPRPPSASDRPGANPSPAPQRAGLCNRSIPRGPPSSFS
jgi:hypothetical protein